MITERTLLLNLLSRQFDDAPRELLADALLAWGTTGDKPLDEMLRERGLLDGAQTQVRTAAEGRLVETTQPQDLEQTSDHDPRATTAFVKDWGARVRGNVSSAASRYQVVRPHAKGGLGEVFVALDQELHREVALKEIQPRFADEERARDRFVLEAEITGNLEHPGIVPVYGLGAYLDGRPYYAMRFIQGDNLKDHVARFHAPFQGDRVAVEDNEPRADPTNKQEAKDRHAVGLEGVAFRQLLRRFIDVCNAVAYAHSRGIIHRDLKPANVMLGNFGETLVVDWGLAKRVGASESESTRTQEVDLEVLTQDGAIVGTPAYASPEQAAGAQVGPTSDVYALGATLFTLLSDQVPVQGKNTLEVLRNVQIGAVAWNRIAGSPLGLRAICRQAMQLQPADRYATAQDLARDVERWLADEPVSCCTEPASVRLRRWGRKHRTLVTSGMLGLVLAATFLAVLSALLNSKNVALAAANVEVTQAKERETTAKESAEGNFTMAKEAVEKYLSIVTEDRELKRSDFTKLRKRLLETAIPFFEKIARQQSDDPEVEAGRGRVYHRLAFLRNETGEKRAACGDYEEMRAIYARLATAFPAERKYQEALASSQNNVGNVLRDLGKRDAARAAFAMALRIQEQLVADFPTNPEYRLDLATTFNNLALLLHEVGDRQGALEAHRQALRIHEELAVDYPAGPENRRKLAGGHSNLGVVLKELGDLQGARAAYVQALRQQEALVVDFPQEAGYRQALAGTHNNLGTLAVDLGDAAAALSAFRQALGIREKLAADFPTVPEYRLHLADSHVNLGVLLRQLNDQKGARAAYDTGLRLFHGLAADFPAVPEYRQGLADTYQNLGVLLESLRESEAAREAYQQAVRTYEKLVTEFPSVPKYRGDLAITNSNLGLVHKTLGNQEAAREAFQQALRLQEKLAIDYPRVPAHAISLGGTYVNYAGLLRDGGLGREALEIYAKGIDSLLPHVSGPHPLAQARAFLRNAYWGQARTLELLGVHAEAAEAWDKTAKLSEGQLKVRFETSNRRSLLRAATEEDPAWAILWGWPRR